MIPMVSIFLIFIPIIATKYIQNKCIVWFLFGMIAPAFSEGLYSLFFIKYIGIFFVIFLPVTLFFNKPAWWLLVEKLSIIDGSELSLANKLELSISNGIFWGFVFALLSCTFKKILGH